MGTKKIGISGAAGFLGQALLTKLADLHEVYAFDLEGAGGGQAVVQADVLDFDDMKRLCAGMDAVIHLACAAWQDGLSEAENETRILDTRLKGTWNMMQAAVDAGVRRVIQVSDLCIFSGYDKDVMVSEDFVPLPDTTAHQQSVYLSELIGREFARLVPGLVLTLRLGKLVDPGSLLADAVFDPAWLDTTDAVRAIVGGLDLNGYDGLSNWGLYNLAADVPTPRFSLLKIKSGQFGFQPEEDFRAWREGDTA